jgi:hypothetical protein
VTPKTLIEERLQMTTRMMIGCRADVERYIDDIIGDLHDDEPLRKPIVAGVADILIEHVNQAIEAPFTQTLNWGKWIDELWGSDDSFWSYVADVIAELRSTELGEVTAIVRKFRDIADPAADARKWLDFGFNATEVEEWLGCGVWNQDVAEEFRDNDLDPSAIKLAGAAYDSLNLSHEGIVEQICDDRAEIEVLLELALIKEVLAAEGDAHTGGTDRGAWEQATVWQDYGFDHSQTRAWAEIGFWSAPEALAVAHAGVSPKQADKAAESIDAEGKMDDENGIIYAICNGDLKAAVLIHRALLDSDQRKALADLPNCRGFDTPPECAGQIVLSSYGETDCWIYERRYDQSDRTVAIWAYEHPDDDACEPWNRTPQLGETVGLIWSGKARHEPNWADLRD